MIKNYYRPASCDEAIGLKAQYGSKGVWLAGGAWLNHQPYADEIESVISLEGLGFNTIQSAGASVSIGSMVCLQDLADNQELPAVLREAINLIPSRHLRNQGTLGGEIGSNNPNSPLLPLLIAQDAQLELADGSTVSIEAYLANADQALIRSIALPLQLQTALSCLRPSSQGLPVIWGALAINQGKARLALGGADAQICRWPNIEQAIDKKLAGEELEALVSDSVKPVEDIRGSVAYKRYLAGVVVTDLVQQSQQEA